MDPCTTLSGKKKKLSRKKCMVFFCVASMLQKSEVESLDECILLELAPSPGTIIPSLEASFIYFHSVFYRTRNRFFPSIWDPYWCFFYKSPALFFFAPVVSVSLLQKKVIKRAALRSCFPILKQRLEERQHGH